jgi:HD-GYP domain-containing protein (c-di-GMP phosphodiesterase class II)
MDIDSYNTPDGEALLQAGEHRRSRPPAERRALNTRLAAAVVFLVASVTLATVARWHQPLSVPRLALVLGAYVLVEQVRFPVAGGWTYPTMLVFVPMLFLLPTPVVPLAAMAAIVLNGVPNYVRRRTPLTRLPADVADAWYAVGPALVIVLGGAQQFSWSHWPIYLAALAAQIVSDMASTIGRCWIGEGINPRVQLPLLFWVYLVDAMLAPLGLLIAASAVKRPGLLLLALPVVGLLWLFARERRERLEQTLVLSSAYRGTALLLGEVIEVDDAYTGIHSRQVVDLAIAVADAVGLDSAKRRSVEFTALLHDVGKIHVPKEILNKPGRLDAGEWKILQRHTIDGERMLRQVGGSLADVGQFVRSSHERYDGHGYPDRLAGEEIPIESRIVSVCDAYNAMTTNRPYHAAISAADALAELRREAGRQFDPAVVAAFEPLVEAEAALVAAPRAQETAAATQVPRWVKIPDGQAERALSLLGAKPRPHGRVKVSAP